MAVVTENLVHDGAAVGDEDAAAGQNFQQAARAHGFRIRDRIDVEGYGVPFVHGGCFGIGDCIVHVQ